MKKTITIQQLKKEITAPMSIIKSREYLIVEKMREWKKLRKDLEDDPRNKEPLQRIKKEIEAEIREIEGEIETIEAITKRKYFRFLPEEDQEIAWDDFYMKRPYYHSKDFWLRKIKTAIDSQEHRKLLKYLTSRYKSYIQEDFRSTIKNRMRHGLTTPRHIAKRVIRIAKELNAEETFKNIQIELEKIDSAYMKGETIKDGTKETTPEKAYFDLLVYVSFCIEEDDLSEEESQILIWVFMELDLIKFFMYNKESYEGLLVEKKIS